MATRAERVQESLDWMEQHVCRMLCLLHDCDMQRAKQLFDEQQAELAAELALQSEEA